MILTKKTIKKINVTKTRLSLAMAMGFTEQWIIRLIDTNRVNGPLTTARALQIIKEQTGLTENEILEEEKIPAK